MSHVRFYFFTDKMVKADIVDTAPYKQFFVVLAACDPFYFIFVENGQVKCQNVKV